MKPAARIPGIDERFGTWRGAVRLALSYPEILLRLAPIRRVDMSEVRRLVFVCQGNICRSAFADVAARRRGLPVASFGLATTSGLPANPAAQAAATAMGYDLTAHRTTARADYKPQPGDLLLAMEVRQLRRIQADPELRELPRSLLGLWARPRAPHLHDPHHLSADYFARCFKRIESAVDQLGTAFSGRPPSAT